MKKWCPRSAASSCFSARRTSSIWTSFPFRIRASSYGSMKGRLRRPASLGGRSISSGLCCVGEFTGYPLLIRPTVDRDNLNPTFRTTFLIDYDPAVNPSLRFLMLDIGGHPNPTPILNSSTAALRAAVFLWPVPAAHREHSCQMTSSTSTTSRSTTRSGG